MTSKFLPLLFLSALGLGRAAAQPGYSAAGKKAQVFTTAQGSSQRLAAGASADFDAAAVDVPRGARQVTASFVGTGDR